MNRKEFIASLILASAAFVLISWLLVKFDALHPMQDLGPEPPCPSDLRCNHASRLPAELYTLRDNLANGMS